MSGVMTYNTLVDDVAKYSERSNSEFMDKIAQFINRAENRIAAEARGLGFIRSITDDLVAKLSYIKKPGRWRETVSFQIGTGAGFDTRIILKQRSYEFCRAYWPNARETSVPKYYGDWDFKHWVIVPTPDIGYPYEILFHERPEPLSANKQTNWTTEHAPQLLLMATLIEAAVFLKRDDRIKTFEDQYNRALLQVEFERQRRLGGDRTRSVAGA